MTGARRPRSLERLQEPDRCDSLRGRHGAQRGGDPHVTVGGAGSLLHQARIVGLPSEPAQRRPVPDREAKTASPGGERQTSLTNGPDMTLPHIEFRPLVESDLALLHSWLIRPHVLEWWSDESTLAGVRAKYLPRIDSGTVRPYLAYVDAEPIGYIQSYVAVETEDGWWAGYSDPSVLGIDQFIADPDRLGQGLGTAMATQFAALLLRDPSITRLQVDPRPDNSRAIRCYERAGFRVQGTITTPDGLAVLLTLDRSPASSTLEPTLPSAPEAPCV